MKRHKYGLDHRKEFDEVFIKNAHVHIERMHETCYWIGISTKDFPDLMINTGVEKGMWFFNIEEDSLKGKSFQVQRPRKPKR